MLVITYILFISNFVFMIISQGVNNNNKIIITKFFVGLTAAFF